MNTKRVIQDVFKVKVSPDKLIAELWYNKPNNEITEEFVWSTKEIITFFETNNITFGLNYSNIGMLIELGFANKFPIIIAEGTPAEAGVDGSIHYTYDFTTTVDRSEGFNFREVMRIPTVQAGDKIAEIIPPTTGEVGRTVYNTMIKGSSGKPVYKKQGKNVTFDKETSTFYASKSGQVSVVNDVIHVYDVYEVSEDLSLKIGNIDFVGTVVIHGNIPTGFRINATGDIKVYGLVEGAELIAGGSIYVAEGIAGFKQGVIEAKKDVHLGYINQAKVKAGNSIYVDNSILHSECTALKFIKCKEGNIIGGTLSAGQSVTSYDIGNRANTTTNLSFETNQTLYNRQLLLEEKKLTEIDNLRKLRILKQKLSLEQPLKIKSRITLLKLKKSFEETNMKVKSIETELASIQTDLDVINDAFLRVEGTIYPNTIISFGKYRKTLKKQYKNVTIAVENNEIKIV